MLTWWCIWNPKANNSFLFPVSVFQFSLVSPSKTFPFRFDVAEEIFESLQTIVSKPQNGTIGISFVSPDEMQNLNKTYRNNNSVTDVLSFYYADDFSQFSAQEPAGDIVLCEERLLEQSKEYRNLPEAECAKLIIHSALHVLGFDHRTDEQYETMKPYEDRMAEVLHKKFGMVIR